MNEENRIPTQREEKAKTNTERRQKQRQRHRQKLRLRLRQSMLQIKPQAFLHHSLSLLLTYLSYLYTYLALGGFRT